MGTSHFKTKPHLWHHSPLTPCIHSISSCCSHRLHPFCCGSDTTVPYLWSRWPPPCSPPWHTAVYCPHRSRSDPVKICVLVTSDPFSKTAASKTLTSPSLPLASTTLPLACSPALSWILNGWLLHKHIQSHYICCSPGYPPPWWASWNCPVTVPMSPSH